MTLQDYAGRTFDILAYQGGTGTGGEQRLKQQLLGDGNYGQTTTGLQKLVQKFLILLLTEKGTKPHDATFGTEFITDARQGLWLTPLDVFSSFAGAVVDVKRRLQEEETATDPADERFASAELTAVTISGLTASVTVELTSKSGSSVKFIESLNFIP